MTEVSLSLRTTLRTVFMDGDGNTEIMESVSEGTVIQSRRDKCWVVTSGPGFSNERQAVSAFRDGPSLPECRDFLTALMADGFPAPGKRELRIRYLERERSVAVDGRESGYDRRAWIFLDVQAVDPVKECRASLRRYLGARLDGGRDLFREVRLVVEDDLKFAGAAELPEPSVEPVLFEPDAAAYLVHELVGHSAEADNFRAVPARTGEARLSIEVWDDPTLPGSAGHYCFDDEGTRPVPVLILDSSGRMRSVTSWRTGEGRFTGHARTVDYTKVSLPRVACTYLKNLGTAGDVDGFEGLRVSRVLGGRWMRGRAIIFCDRGVRTKGSGRIIARYRGLGIVVSIDKFAAGLQAAGGNFEWFHDLCGKADQYPLPVSMGSPSLVLSEVRVGPRGEVLS